MSDGAAIPLHNPCTPAAPNHKHAHIHTVSHAYGVQNFSPIVWPSNTKSRLTTVETVHGAKDASPIVWPPNT